MNKPLIRSPMRLFFYAATGAVLFFLIMPTIIASVMSFEPGTYLSFPPDGFSLRWYRAFFSDPDWVNAALFSLKVAVLTSLVSTVIGVLAAIALERGRLPGKEIIYTLILAPLVVPHIIVALAAYLHFAPLRLTGTLAGFVAIHTALSVPYVVIMVSAALQRVEFSLEMAALSLGASRSRAFLDIIVPLIQPAIVGATVFAFLASFDETTVAFFISGVENKTITRKLFEDIDFNLSPIIAAVSTLFIVVTVGLMALSKLRLKRASAGST